MRPQDKKGLVVAVAALGAAIATELSKPAEDRTWHGTIVGVVPYDLRVPTPDSVRRKLWNPTGNFWSPQVFGVGWTFNFGRLAAQLGLLGPEAARATRPAPPGPASPAPASPAPESSRPARPVLPTADDPDPDA